MKKVLKVGLSYRHAVCAVCLLIYRTQKNLHTIRSCCIIVSYHCENVK